LKVSYPLAVQPKLDGIRCSIVNGRALTRTLKEVPNRAIFNALSSPEFEGLDGELIVGEPTAPDCYRRTSSGVMGHDPSVDWAFYVFDKWNTDEDFSARWHAIRAQIGPAGPDSDAARQRIRIVPHVIVLDALGLENYEEILLNAGHEGAILRDPNGFYKFGRASATKGELLKLKRFIDFEAEVIGAYEEQHNGNEAVTNALGRTERSTAAAGKVGKGRLGGLVLRRLSDGQEFRCGTGFDRAMREALWTENLIGRTAKIKAFEIGAKDKPRFPVFLGWRNMEFDGPLQSC
jgi:DNA ligase-1